MSTRVVHIHFGAVELGLEVFDRGGPQAHVHEEDGGDGLGEVGGLLRHAFIGGDVTLELELVSFYSSLKSLRLLTMPRSVWSVDLMPRTVLFQL